MSDRQYPGALYQRELDDGRVIVVYQMFYNARICIGPANEPTYDDAWCYPDQATALKAAAEWDGEGDPPVGWIKQVGTGRRRVDGDPSREYVMP